MPGVLLHTFQALAGHVEHTLQASVDQLFLRYLK